MTDRFIRIMWGLTIIAAPGIMKSFEGSWAFDFVKTFFYGTFYSMLGK
jgi:hypothetical protein